MITNYFQSLNYAATEGNSGLYVVYYGTEEWYCCAYKDRNNFKSDIVDSVNRLMGLSTSKKDWEFHHIVEKQHIADLPLTGLGLGTLNDYYINHIPTVLISKSEHSMISSFFHFKEFRQLYYVDQLGTSAKNVNVRQSTASSNYSAGSLNKADVVKIINGLIEMYANVYILHPAFQIISRNFLNDLKYKVG